MNPCPYLESPLNDKGGHCLQLSRLINTNFYLDYGAAEAEEDTGAAGQDSHRIHGSHRAEKCLQSKLVSESVIWRRKVF